jgi:hypothetical protein
VRIYGAAELVLRGKAGSMKLAQTESHVAKVFHGLSKTPPGMSDLSKSNLLTGIIYIQNHRRLEYWALRPIICLLQPRLPVLLEHRYCSKPWMRQAVSVMPTMLKVDERLTSTLSRRELVS